MRIVISLNGAAYTILYYFLYTYFILYSIYVILLRKYLKSINIHKLRIYESFVIFHSQSSQ